MSFIQNRFIRLLAKLNSLKDFNSLPSFAKRVARENLNGLYKITLNPRDGCFRFPYTISILQNTRRRFATAPSLLKRALADFSRFLVVIQQIYYFNSRELALSDSKHLINLASFLIISNCGLLSSSSHKIHGRLRGVEYAI